ncbi:MAG: response regulator transcription factor, partial [Acetobacteraceae bacterium]|nr:response regulator transcription factor [Acetobacteraceae bacterium]
GWGRLPATPPRGGAPWAGGGAAAGARAGLGRLLAATPGLNLVAETDDVPGFLRRAGEPRPDVVLMDALAFGDMGVSYLRQVCSRLVGSRALVLTSYADPSTVAVCLEAGASGYVLKSVSPEQLVESIKLVSSGGLAVLLPGLASARPRSLGLAPWRGPDSRCRLSEREREVARLLARGRCNADIARSLFLSEKTVRNYVSRLYRKLGVRTRAEAALFLIGSGLAG